MKLKNPIAKIIWCAYKYFSTSRNAFDDWLVFMHGLQLVFTQKNTAVSIQNAMLINFVHMFLSSPKHPNFW